MKKKLPKLLTDKAAEIFVAEADLTEYDLSGLTPVHFEFQTKDERITMRPSEALLEAIKGETKRSRYAISALFVKRLKKLCLHRKAINGC